MNLKQYFSKIREIEATIATPFLLVSSLETSDGGKPGVVTEVPRDVAAKMIAEGRAVLASKSEKEHFFDAHAAGRAAAEKAELARRLHVTLVSDSEPGRPLASLPGGNPVLKK